MAFKIAVDAGHWYGVPERRCLKSVDPNETREWTMNDRVADYFAEAAAQYDGVEILRVDDTTGKKNVSLADRCAKANKWGANLYLSDHHNWGIKGGKGGGVVTFCYKNGGQAQKYRDAIYNAVIAAGGLKGNRAEPKTTANFQVLRDTSMPAVLIECGFMDSTTDIPKIITPAYSKLVGYAMMEGVAKIAGLKKKKEKTVAKNDYSAHWAKSAIQTVIDKKIMVGDGNGKFLPDDKITRAEVAQTITNLLKYLGK